MTQTADQSTEKSTFTRRPDLANKPHFDDNPAKETT